MMNLEIAYKISVSILLLSTFISAIELISIPKLFNTFVYSKADYQGRHQKWLVIHGLQASLSILTFISLIGLTTGYFKLFFTLLTVVTFYSYSHRKIGKDGCDQVRLLTFLSYSVCFLLPKEQGEMYALFFSGIQVIVGYATSGLAKVFSRQWRGGKVLSGILSTYSYGIPKICKRLNSYPVLEKVLTYMAILAMLSVPVCIFLPFKTLLLIALASALFFHVATAILMGLNDFLFTFPLAYPGIILLHSFIFEH